MQNGHISVTTAEKSPQPGVANWTPDEKLTNGNVIGGEFNFSVAYLREGKN